MSLIVNPGSGPAAERHGDGSTNFKWCLVQFDDDDEDNRMLCNDASPKVSLAGDGPGGATGSAESPGATTEVDR